MLTTESIKTSILDIAFHRYGSPSNRTVILLHGWPDCALTWHEVALSLASKDLHVLVPYLRGYGPTRFLHDSTPRSGQLSALAQDVIDFADVLGIEKFDVVGHDWGARAAYISACLWPHRIRTCTAMSVGWGTNNADQPLSLNQVQNYWYHWYMATPRGETLVREDRRGLTEHIWNIWCPFWKISATEFDVTAATFNNPDWADVVLHSYRHRWGGAKSDDTYSALEKKLTNPPLISVPTMVLHGADDPCNLPVTSEGREKFFIGKYERYLVEHCGHFPQREQAADVAQRVLSFLGKYYVGTASYKA
jgi:pimeloyl-ACP methyl ester carboxylesterase